MLRLRCDGGKELEMGKARALTIGRQSYWREADAREVFAAWERSGVSLSQFAREAGIRPRRLFRWRRLLQGRPEVTFHPVRVVAKDGVVVGARVEVVLANGVVVRVPDGVSDETVVRVLLVAAGMPAC
jgi:hypothetical protein